MQGAGRVWDYMHCLIDFQDPEHVEPDDCEQAGCEYPVKGISKP
jgi:hypothetical protein